MKKIYLAAALVVLLPMMASAATLGSSISTNSNVSPLFRTQVTPATPVADPGFAWGFYPTPSGDPYVITFNCITGCGWSPMHDMTVTSFDPNTGAFTATGVQEGYPGITWTANGTTTVGAGNTTGTITFHIAYDASSGFLGYTVDASGTVSNDGSLAGTAVSPQDGNTYTWTMNRLAEAASTFKRMPSCDGWDGWNGTSLVGTSTLTGQSAPDARIDGSIWAQDAFTWKLRVRQISTSPDGNNNYCAIVSFVGSYATPAGKEYGPYQPTSTADTIGGKTTGGFVGSEIYSFYG